MNSGGNVYFQWYVKLAQSLLPYEQMIYTTELSKDEVLDRLEGAIEPYKPLRMWPRYGEKPYQGDINGNDFSVLRIIYYKNAYQPRIVGTVVQHNNKTEVHVSMRLRHHTHGITLGLMLFAGLLLFASNFNGAPMLIMLFIYGLTILGFKYESAKSRRFFAYLFESVPERLI